ncbi:MAG: hypothetical protein EOO76_14520 [Novosphingobium sp.]|nr:MAG: hypothetical protein EOO76_14520 [Novosphingobium sp.]
MRKRLLWVLLAIAAAPAAARAEWLEASSAHFVVYADDSERDIRTFSQQLERYHSAMALLTGARDAPPPSPSNRVTVFVVSNQAQVRKLYGEGSRYVGGFYMPRAGASAAIVPRVATGTAKPAPSMLVLLHEYAHHFMISTSAFPMPRWYSEGGAEFFASAGFPSDGAVEIGRPAMHRAAELLLPGFARDVPVAELLDPAARRRDRTGYDAFYGKSWALFHYLTFDKARDGQMLRYLQGMQQGKSSREAGLAAFGDFDQLERDLNSYLHKSRTMMFNLKPDMIAIGPVEVRRLTAGEAAMMAVRVQSHRGVTAEKARALLPEARAVALRFPEDPAVLASLAEAEHDAGNDAEAIVAADAAIARNPALASAHVQKGMSLFRQAATATDRTAAYSKARVAFAVLNRREPDHPLPLIYYYRSFVEQGLAPPDLALHGLARAVEMAPFDLGLRMTLGMALIRRHEGETAKRAIAPVAYNPHGGRLAAIAQTVMARLDSDPKWDGSGIETVNTGDDEE